MAQIRRPAVQLPSAPPAYSQREEQEFRRVVERILTESIEDATRPSAQTTFEVDDPQTADDVTDRYYYSWTASGHPVGTTYNLVYRYINTAGTLEEAGTITGATSGGYVQSSGNVGLSPSYEVTVNAINAGQITATATRIGIFTT